MTSHEGSLNTTEKREYLLIRESLEKLLPLRIMNENPMPCIGENILKIKNP